MQRNPSLDLLKPIKDPAFIQFCKDELNEGKARLFTYHAHKLASGSTHFLFMHEKTIENYINAFKLIGLIDPSEAFADKQQARYRALDVMKEHHLSRLMWHALHEVIVSTQPPDVAGSNHKLIDQWQRECSAYVASIHLLEESLKFNDLGNPESFEIMDPYLRNKNVPEPDGLSG